MRSSLPTLAAFASLPLLALTLALTAAPLASQAPTLALPAFTGYAHPDADAIERRRISRMPWTSQFRADPDSPIRDRASWISSG